MIPSDQFGTVPRVGVEIEVPHWGDKETVLGRGAVCQHLIDAGLMDSSLDAPFTNNYHPYNCRCVVCVRWERDDCDPYPVQFTLEYDASLPDIGGEFITSPFPVLEWNYNSFFEGWEIITANAVRDVEIASRNGGPSSPSIHVHASCVNPTKYDPGVAQQFYQAFSPEIFAFATSTGLDRGMEFRHTDFNTRHGDRLHQHHRFVNIKSLGGPNALELVIPGGGPHTELRVWEAEFDEDWYIKGAVFISAGLTQLAANANIANRMIAYTIMSDREVIVLSPAARSCSPLMNLAKAEYFDILFEALTTATFIAYDEIAYTSVRTMFENTRRRMNV